MATTNETKQVRITVEAYNALEKLVEQLTAERGVPVNLTYAASIAILDTVERLGETNPLDTK